MHIFASFPKIANQLSFLGTKTFYLKLEKKANKIIVHSKNMMCFVPYVNYRHFELGDIAGYRRSYVLLLSKNISNTILFYTTG